MQGVPPSRHSVSACLFPSDTPRSIRNALPLALPFHPFIGHAIAPATSARLALHVGSCAFDHQRRCKTLMVVRHATRRLTNHGPEMPCPLNLKPPTSPNKTTPENRSDAQRYADVDTTLVATRAEPSASSLHIAVRQLQDLTGRISDSGARAPDLPTRRRRRLASLPCQGSSPIHDLFRTATLPHPMSL
jgi:hypothetical protein